jgi:hypothetical protein
MILKKTTTVPLCAGVLILLAAATPVSAQTEDGFPHLECDPATVTRFAPPQPVLGRYELCSDSRPLSDIARPDWRVEALEPLDAFGAAGLYNRSVVARLYGGMRVRVSHRWNRTPERFEALTFVSPYPSSDLTHLESGTLIIRWMCEVVDERCRAHGEH